MAQQADSEHAGDGDDPAPAAADRTRRVVLVTGMSGAGRSTALKALEDVGYEAIDNLPVRLIPAVLLEGGQDSAVAVGIDIRTRNFAVQPVLDALETLQADPRLSVTLLFVDCEDEVLRRRFTETRRPHPLAHGRPVSDGLAAERRLVAPLRQRADLTIDSSTLAPHDLRRTIAAQFALDCSPGMAIFVTSFSYKNGLPREADLVFDVRFLRNPHYAPELRPLTGRNQAVADYVAGDPEFQPFFDRLSEMLTRLIPRYEQEGKSYLTIAIGCTGGRHRSVAIAERLRKVLEDQGRSVILTHRALAAAEDTAPVAAGAARLGDASASDSR